MCLAAFAIFIWCGSLPASAADRISPEAYGELAAKAAAVLDTHCARCHQAGRLAPGAPANSLLDILDLQGLARDPSLVRPGLPDGSRLYTSMLRRAMPPDAHGADGIWTGPAADEVQAVRDWIEAIPARSTVNCTRLSAPSADLEIAAVLWRLDSATAVASRFITLRHLDTVCTDPRELEQHRDALKRLVAQLSRKQPAAMLEPVDVRGTVFQVSLDALGWTPADWDRLSASDPMGSSLHAQKGFEVAARITGSVIPVVRGDWLAHTVLRARTLPVGAPLADEDGRISALARTWERHLDLDTAAVEMAIDREELARLLENAPAPVSVLARRLRQGLLSRDEFLVLRAALIGAPDNSFPAPGEVDGKPQQLELAIWSDKLAYSKGELLALHAWSNTDCYLTLISLDQEGRATVLFPNEMQPDNRLTGGRVLTVPAADAAYQLRLADDGRERVVGVCTGNAGLADGIQADYDRQRFTMLGDWRAFLARSWTQSASETAPAPRRPGRFRRGSGKRQEPAKVERPSPGQHARTAISFEVR